MKRGVAIDRAMYWSKVRNSPAACSGSRCASAWRMRARGGFRCAPWSWQRPSGTARAPERTACTSAARRRRSGSFCFTSPAMPMISRGTGVVVAQLDSLADRILARPVFRGHGFVDHDDGRRLLIVALRERAPADDFDPERREIVRTDAEERRRCPDVADRPLDRRVRSPCRCRSRSSAAWSRPRLRSPTGSAPTSSCEPAIEGDHRRGAAITRLRQQQLHRDGALGPEPGADPLQDAQGSDEQTGRSEQHQ